MIPLIPEHFIDVDIIPAIEGSVLDNTTGFAEPQFNAPITVKASPQPVPGEEILQLDIGEKVEEAVEFIFDKIQLNGAYEAIGLQGVKKADKILYDNKEYSIRDIESWSSPLQLSHIYIFAYRLREEY